MAPPSVGRSAVHDGRIEKLSFCCTGGVEVAGVGAAGVGRNDVEDGDDVGVVFEPPVAPPAPDRVLASTVTSASLPVPVGVGKDRSSVSVARAAGTVACVSAGGVVGGGGGVTEAIDPDPPR